VQALYQMDIGGAGVLEIVAEYEAHRLGHEIDGDQYRPADAAWFRAVVSGVVENQRALDPVIRASLTEDWPLSRLDATLAGDPAGRAPGNCQPRRMCRSRSSLPNMSMLRAPSSRKTNPRSSTRCLTGWRANTVAATGSETGLIRDGVS
jgi:hypothetical protein